MQGRTCALAVLAVLSLGSCADATSQGCSDSGGASGVSVTVPANLYRVGRQVDVELCQSGQCQAASTDLSRAGGRVTTSLDFAGFATIFDEGPAQVVVTVRDGAQVVRALESEVTLSHTYPNGRECDGDTWLSGEADLR